MALLQTFGVFTERAGAFEFAGGGAVSTEVQIDAGEAEVEAVFALVQLDGAAVVRGSALEIAGLFGVEREHELVQRIA